MRSEVITVKTGTAPAVRDLTPQAQAFIAGESDGLLHVFVPHATAGVAVIETGGARTRTCCGPSTICSRPIRSGGGTSTERRVTGATTCCRGSSPRALPFRCSAAGSCWAHGSRFAWSTRTETTLSARSGSRFCPRREKLGRLDVYQVAAEEAGRP